MKTILQFILVAAIGLAAISMVGLLAMSSVATSHDVVRVPVPRTSYLSDIAPTTDYADAYHAPMKFSSFVSIEEMEKEIFHKGSGEVHRSDAEIVYKGKAPGLSYHIGYMLGVSDRPRTLTVSTAVEIHNWMGRVYWTLVRPIHRMLVPVMLDRMAQAAPRR